MISMPCARGASTAFSYTPVSRPCSMVRTRTSTCTSLRRPGRTLSASMTLILLAMSSSCSLITTQGGSLGDVGSRAEKTTLLPSLRTTCSTSACRVPERRQENLPPRANKLRTSSLERSGDKAWRGRSDRGACPSRTPERSSCGTARGRMLPLGPARSSWCADRLRFRLNTRWCADRLRFRLNTRTPPPPIRRSGRNLLRRPKRSASCSCSCSCSCSIPACLPADPPPQLTRRRERRGRGGA